MSFSQTPQIKKYRVGWLEKSHALSLERERDDRKRARMRRSVIRCVAEVRFCAEVKVCCSQRWSCASSRVHRMLVPHVIENISNLKLLTTPNEDAISQTLLLNRASNALQTHISATLIAPLDSQAAREYNESLNNNIRFLFCGGGVIFFTQETCMQEFFRKYRTKNLAQKKTRKRHKEFCLRNQRGAFSLGVRSGEYIRLFNITTCECSIKSDVILR